MTHLNCEQIMEIIRDPEQKQCIYMTSFVRIEDKDEPAIWYIPDAGAEAMIKSIVTAYENQGTKWQDIKFKVHFSGDTMFLEVNYPPELH